MAKIAAVFHQEEIKKEVHPRRITKWIHYTKLRTNKDQYCEAKDKEEIKRLADLIEASGEVLQDLLVRKIDTDEYEIIAGHKRCAACRLLVEERSKSQYEFLPCVEKNISDVKAEFNVYSSNGHHVETPYEIMHKLERMEYLLQNYPEEFPDMQRGRMVERLGRQFQMSKTTVQEYQTISSKLGSQAMDAFRDGVIDKSAAVTLASMPCKVQDGLIDTGLLTNKELQEYKKKELEPTEKELKYSYDVLIRNEWKGLGKQVLLQHFTEGYGKTHAGMYRPHEIDIQCSPGAIIINGKNISWKRYMNLLAAAGILDQKNDEKIPQTAEESRLEYLSVSDEAFWMIKNREQSHLIVEENPMYTVLGTIHITAGSQEVLAISINRIIPASTEPGLKKGYLLLYLGEVQEEKGYEEK